MILAFQLTTLVKARDIGRASFHKMLRNVTPAVLFFSIGVPLAATGLVCPVWAMAAMAAGVTAIFLNSLWGGPSLLFDAILSVGRPASASPQR